MSIMLTPSHFARSVCLVVALAVGLGFPLEGRAQKAHEDGLLCLPSDSLTFTPNRAINRMEEVGRAYCLLQARDLGSHPGVAAGDLLFGLPSVDRIRTGLIQGNVSQRGFNPLFSGPMVLLEDMRPAQVPVFQRNALHLLSSTWLDLDRVEVAPGGISHLYGAHGTGGVLHYRTLSPMEDAGTRGYLGAGERGLVEGAFRQGIRISPAAAFRVSAHYLQGDDWTSRDPVEEALQNEALTSPSTTRDGFIGLREEQVARWGASARLDLHVRSDTEIMVSGGSSTAMKSLEFSDLGALQAIDWRLSHGQMQARRGELFAQIHGTLSQTGDTYLVRSGRLLDDRSWRAGGRLQHGVEVASGRILYGVDASRIQPGSPVPGGGVVRDEQVDEVGAYLRGQVPLTREVFISAGARLDWHSGLEDPVLSPGVEVSFNPGDGHSFYGGFSQSFSPPTPFQLQLDLPSGDLPVGDLRVPIRAGGVPSSGYTFQHDPGICGGGLGGYCMRTSHIAGAPRVPVQGALLWNPILLRFAPESTKAVLASLLDPSPNEVKALFRRLDPNGGGLGAAAFVFDPEGPQSAERLRPSRFTSLEAGYRGSPLGWLRVQADMFASQVLDLVGPLRVETPSVFYDPDSVAGFVQNRLLPLVESGRLTAGEFESLVQELTAVMTNIPLGTVTADQQEGAEVLMTYRNVGDALLFGGELAVEVDLTSSLSLLGFYGYLSTRCLGTVDTTGMSDSCTGRDEVALNAPAHKGGGGVRYRDPGRGIRGEVRVGSRGGFPMASGLVVGPVAGGTTVDVALGTQVPRLPGVDLSVSLANAFDLALADLPGGPAMGRLLVVRLGYARH